jgi:hypothetical protein
MLVEFLGPLAYPFLADHNLLTVVRLEVDPRHSTALSPERLHLLYVGARRECHHFAPLLGRIAPEARQGHWLVPLLGCNVGDAECQLDPL